MKVLWIAPYPYSSHQHPAPWIIELAKAMSQIKHIQLTILTYSHLPKKNIERRNVNGYEVIFIKIPRFRFDLLTGFKFRILLLKKWLVKNECNYNIIHIQGTEHQYEIAALATSKPILISIQGLLHKAVDYVPKRKIIQKVSWTIGAFYEKKGIKSHKTFIGRTDWDRNSILSLNPGASYHSIWEVVRKPFFEIEKINLSSNNQILFIGGDNILKGVREALMIFNVIARSHNVKMLIGGSSKKENIENFIQKYQLTNVRLFDNLFLAGFLDVHGLVHEMKKSVLLLHPSYIDNSPNSICEAQVAGLPVVAINVGGVSSLIQHNITGLLCKNTIEDIIENVLKIYGDRDLAEKIATNAKKVARKRHNRENILNQTLLLYNSIADVKHF